MRAGSAQSTKGEFILWRGQPNPRNFLTVPQLECSTYVFDALRRMWSGPLKGVSAQQQVAARNAGWKQWVISINL